MIRVAVVPNANTWNVIQDDIVVSQRDSKPEAVALAHLLAVATKASGGQSTLWIENDARQLELSDTDQLIS